MSGWCFRSDVGDVDDRGSSTSYLVTVFTNLEVYSEHGSPTDGSQAALAVEEEEGPEENDDETELAEMVSRLKIIPERRIAVRRTYTDFVKYRDALEKSGLPGTTRLPQLPAKKLFGSQEAKVIAERKEAFCQLLAYVGSSDALATAEETAAFLYAVQKPDYPALHEEVIKRAKAVTSLSSEGWDVRYDKRDIKIAVQKLETSPFYLVRSEMLVPLPVDIVVKHYKRTENWKDWMPDATFKEVERISDSACVMLISYKIPVISNRDVCLYEASSPGLAWDPSSSAHTSMFACSLEHPECPRRRGWVRALLRVSVTVFEKTPDGSGTRILSIQHSDPRGKVPANVVNQMIVRGKHQLKEMRRVMVEKLGR